MPHMRQNTPDFHQILKLGAVHYSVTIFNIQI